MFGPRARWPNDSWRSGNAVRFVTVGGAFDGLLDDNEGAVASNDQLATTA